MVSLPFTEISFLVCRCMFAYLVRWCLKEVSFPFILISIRPLATRRLLNTFTSDFTVQTHTGSFLRPTINHWWHVAPFWLLLLHSLLQLLDMVIKFILRLFWRTLRLRYDSRWNDHFWLDCHYKLNKLNTFFDDVTFFRVYTKQKCFLTFGG